MLDIKLLREESERVKKAIAAKNADPKLVDEFGKLDAEWRALTAELDGLRAEQKKISKERNKEQGTRNKEEIKKLEGELRALEEKRDAVWQKIPNLPSEDTPVGKDETTNKVIRVVGEPRDFSAKGGSASGGKPKNHFELGEALGLIDIETAAKVSGARFAYLKGGAVELGLALVHYAFAILTNPNVVRSSAEGTVPGYNGKPFVPVAPPLMMRAEVMQKMARLEPKEERYHIPSDDLYLIGSAEHTLGPLHMDETIPEKDLPLRYVAFTPSFRREAGSYGKDTRGILRLHQFDKIEMESFTTPEQGETEQNFFVAMQEYLMWSLELPYRVVICSTGDQGDPDARHLDLETWFPGESKYRETHSADYMTDYQARRLNTKVKRSKTSAKGGSASGGEFIHMNDATVFAIGRTVAAIFENYQTKEGKIEVPRVLQRYVGKKVIE
ncbi:MAG: serine--tRNA ligase [Candidatus Liptonbacteria bacterium]|nr:serine--tRNA ligase [Candidatus Liptonbacteria bacterium]